MMANIPFHLPGELFPGLGPEILVRLIQQVK
jgi:hypothetical protein